MKKINNYSAQFKVIQKPVNTEGASRENYNNNIHTQSAFGNNNIQTQSAFGNSPKKKLSKQNQEFINKISASGFKQFTL